MNTRLARLRTLMDERGYDAVIVRNNADLRWLTGAARVFDDEVAHTAVITQAGAWLHTDSRYFGMFVERMGTDSPWQVDQEAMSHTAWVARLLRRERVRCAAVEDTVTLGFYEKLGTELNKASYACLMPRLHGDIAKLRMVKDEEELSLLRRAQQITDAAFGHLCSYVHAGLTELEIRAELEYFMLSHGGEALSFESIIAAGPNGANPHARPSSRVVEQGDLIVIDFGAMVGDHHADMTRTVCVGTPTDEQRHVYDVVRRAHEECAAAARPGMAGRDLHNIAVRVIADAGYGEYFAHGLGHGVGLEIHERPSVSSRSVDTLPQGSVFTIEPGIYLPGRFGIRLEDTGVMGSDGYEPFAASTHDLVCVG